ncbi:MAG: oligosaccharide flippase family protein [Bacteroidales bacterium]|jgi:O-antigen/teichoic acid export membrane protein|nr:oligosaccharide flippase family protein [Bacteroidales bacterium]MDD4214674.1 oligosaccharide flippase family protein [Bacteroidales bacterium]
MSANRKFITNLIILLFLNLLIKPFWILGIDRSVQNTVGAENYGFYFAIFNFTFLFNILLDMGITNFNNRNIAQNNHLLNKHFSSIVILKFLLAVVYFVITMSAGLIIGYSQNQMLLLGILCFNQFLISFILYLRSNISGLHFFKTDSVISVLDRILMIGICGVLLWGNVTKQAFKIEWFVFAQTGSYIITAIIAMFIVIRKAHFKKLKWNRPFFILIIKRSFPFAILVLLMAFYNRIDSVMIERLLPDKVGEQQAGLYASAYRLLDAANMIAYLFSVILLPMFARMLKFKDDIEKLARLSFTLLFVLSITVALGSFFHRHELMEMLYPVHSSETTEAYLLRMEETSWVFGILMSGFIPISTTYVFGTLLTANGNLKYLNIVAGSGMALNLILNFILIPHLQATGSAYASITTQFITAAIQVFLVVKIFRFKLNFAYLSRLGIFFVMILVFNIMSHIISEKGYTDWKISFITMLILSFITAASTKLLNIKSFVSLIKKQEKI